MNRMIYHTVAQIANFPLKTQLTQLPYFCAEKEF